MKKKNVIITIIVSLFAIICSILSFFITNNVMNDRNFLDFDIHQNTCLYGCPYYKKRNKKYFANLLNIIKNRY